MKAKDVNPSNFKVENVVSLIPQHFDLTLFISS